MHIRRDDLIQLHKSDKTVRPAVSYIYAAT